MGWLLEMWTERKWMCRRNSLALESIYYRRLLSAANDIQNLFSDNTLQCLLVDHLIILIIGDSRLAQLAANN